MAALRSLIGSLPSVGVDRIAATHAKLLAFLSNIEEFICEARDNSSPVGLSANLRGAGYQCLTEP